MGEKSDQGTLEREKDEEQASSRTLTSKSSIEGPPWISSALVRALLIEMPWSRIPTTAPARPRPRRNGQAVRRDGTAPTSDARRRRQMRAARRGTSKPQRHASGTTTSRNHPSASPAPRAHARGLTRIHYVKTSNRSHNICNGSLTPVTSTHICNSCCLAPVTYKRARTTPGLASTTPVTNVDFW
jgi:Tfp pilus assembly protein FimV